jgi:hypothetical protein
MSWRQYRLSNIMTSSVDRTFDRGCKLQIYNRLANSMDGATTLSIMTFCLMALSTNSLFVTLSIYNTQHYSALPLCSVSRVIYGYAKYHYAECHYAVFHYAKCHYVACHYAECRVAQLINGA